jgi:MerR family mercuric resistance operon transcriptional regulator
MIARLTIGELARRTGVGIEAIRFYEKIGITPRPARTNNGRRAYGPEDVEALRFIKQARRFGFSLKDVSALLALRDKQDCVSARSIAAGRLKEIQKQLRDLRAREKVLIDAISRCPGATGVNCTVLEIFEAAA